MLINGRIQLHERERAQLFPRWLTCLNCYWLLILFALQHFSSQLANRGEEPSMVAYASVARGRKNCLLPLNPFCDATPGVLPLRHSIPLVFPRKLFERTITWSSSPKVHTSYQSERKNQGQIFSEQEEWQIRQSRGGSLKLVQKTRILLSPFKHTPHSGLTPSSLKKGQCHNEFLREIFMEMSPALVESQLEDILFK